MWMTNTNLTARSMLDGQVITENRGPSMATVIYVMHSIASFICIARLLTRGVLLRAFGKDDYMMMITLVLSTCMTATVPLQVRSGAGVHAEELRKVQRSYIQKMAWLSQVFYLPTLWALKLSILGLYLRVTTQRKHKVVLAVFAVILTGHTFSTTITNIFLCKSQKTIWDVDNFPVGCIAILEFNYFNAVFHIVSDIVLVVLPIIILSGLQISTRKRIGLAAIFSLGLTACALTVVRVVMVVRWSHSRDFPWTWMPVALFTNLEVNTAMIMACMPALNVLMKRVLNLSSTHDDSGGYELKGTHGTGDVLSRTKGSAKRKSVMIMTLDNDSEQGIMRSLHPQEGTTNISGGNEYSESGGIVRTNEVRIHWESKYS